MTRTLILGGMVLALASPAVAAPPERRLAAAEQPPAMAEPVETDAPSMVRDALVGLQLFHQHQGRDGLDPAAIARERSLDEAQR